MVSCWRWRLIVWHPHTKQNKELLYASRAYPSARSVLFPSGDKKTKKKEEGGTAESSKGIPVITAFVFTMSAAANCEVRGAGWGI